MSTKRRGPAQPVLAADASAPPKVYRTTTLTLDLIPLNVGIYSAVSTPDSVRSRFIMSEDGTYHPVGMKPYDKVTGEVIEDPSDIVRGVETLAGVVEITDEELKFGTHKVCRIEDFINLSTLSPEELLLICPTKYYQVRAARKKVGRAYQEDVESQKRYLMILDSMRRFNLHALVQITMNDEEPPKRGLLDCMGQLRILSHQNYIRQELPLGDLAELGVPEHEQKMMDTLIKGKLRASMPPIVDDSSKHLEQVLASKEATGVVTPAAEVVQRVDMPSVDLLEAIEQSIAAAKAK